jgi:hypothetical protein
LAGGACICPELSGIFTYQSSLPAEICISRHFKIYVESVCLSVCSISTLSIYLSQKAMHSLSLLALTGTLSLASAQAINMAAVLDTPLPPLSLELLAPPPAITYDAAAATSSIAAAAAASSNTPPAIQRRLLTARTNATCSPLAHGAGPVPSPDTSYAFLNAPELSSAAKEAQAPTNYTTSFTNLHAATTAPTYLGVAELSAYDAAACAKQCDERAGCTAINVYFERTPTLQLGDDCRNPPSSTLVKCTFWGEAVTEKNAQNTGYTEQGFVVAIAGSNGYNKGDAAKVAAKSWGARTGVSVGATLAWVGLVAGIAVGM